MWKIYRKPGACPLGTAGARFAGASTCLVGPRAGCWFTAGGRGVTTLLPRPAGARKRYPPAADRVTNLHQSSTSPAPSGSDFVPVLVRSARLEVILGVFAWRSVAQRGARVAHLWRVVALCGARVALCGAPVALCGAPVARHIRGEERRLTSPSPPPARAGRPGGRRRRRRFRSSKNRSKPAGNDLDPGTWPQTRQIPPLCRLAGLGRPTGRPERRTP